MLLKGFYLSLSTLTFIKIASLVFAINSLSDGYTSSINTSDSKNLVMGPYTLYKTHKVVICYAPINVNPVGEGVRARGGDLMPETIPLSAF